MRLNYDEIRADNAKMEKFVCESHLWRRGQD